MVDLTTSWTAPSLDLVAIRKRAEYVPVWDESVQCADPCYICGGRAVTYINPAANATATFGPTKLYAICKEHAGRPWDFHGGCRSDALALLSEVERLEQQLAEATEQLRRQGEVLRGYADKRNWFQTTHLQGGDWPVKVWAWDDQREPWSMAQKVLDAASPAANSGEPDYAEVLGDRDENGETDIERARRLDDENDAHAASSGDS